MLEAAGHCRQLLLYQRCAFPAPDTPSLHVGHWCVECGGAFGGRGVTKRPRCKGVVVVAVVVVITLRESALRCFDLVSLGARAPEGLARLVTSEVSMTSTFLNFD